MSKAVKRRMCPAVRHEISAAECGENRISRYACPEACPFNPFSPAQYASFLEIEGSLINKSREWLLDSSPNRTELSRQLDRIAGMDLATRQTWQVEEFFYKRNARGKTPAEAWADAGFPGLKNDERVIQRAVMQLRPRLIEVHRVFDDLRFEVVDLLEPGSKPFLVCDRSLSSRICRFTTLIGWFFPLPHFWRSFGFATACPNLGPFGPYEVALELVRHLGGPEDRAAWPEWFGLNFGRFSKAFDAVSYARREEMLAGMDAEFGKAIYELRAPFAECRARLDSISAVAPDSLAEGEQDEGFAEARVWFDESPAHNIGDLARPTLGRVLLGQAHWRLETMGGEKFARLRQEFENVFGEHVRFTGDRRENLAEHLKSKQPAYDRSLVPPRLLEQPSKILISASRIATAALSDPNADVESECLADQAREWLNESVPALDGKTPREAARDPAVRPQLIRLLKERVRSCDERNLERGSSDDLNWMLKELGTSEIIFDPPPPRAPIAPPSAGEFPEVGLEPWPELPPRPFTADESYERMGVALRDFPSYADAADAMEDAGGFLIEDVRNSVGDLLNEAEYSYLEEYLVQAWFAFVPPGYFGPVIEPEEIHAAISKQLELLEEAAVRGPEASGRFMVAQGPQVHLVQEFAGMVVDHFKELAKEHKLRMDTMPLIVITLRAVIELLDSKCREKLV